LICKKLNKEQVSLLELFKNRNRIWIKIQEASRVWIWIEFDELLIETSRIDEIWTRSSCLDLDNRSSHEKKFGISNSMSFLDLLPEFDLKLTLVYSELD
jgi:hypothetical protein